MPTREHLAQQRTGADANGKHHQQQRSHTFVAVQHIARKAWKLRQEHRAKEPHPRNTQKRAEDHHVAMRQLEVAPGFGEGVPVDDQARVGGWRKRHPLRQQPAQQGQAHTGDGDIGCAHAGHRNQQTTGHIAQQDGHEGAHLHHAIATRELALRQMLRQVGKLDGPEQRAVQPHQEDTAQQHGDVLPHKTPGRQQHDGDLQALDEADQHRLVELVCQLPAGGGEQQEGQDEQRPDHQAGHRRWQPGHLQLVGHEHGKGELEDVVVAGAQELHPEEGRKAALAQQGKLVGVVVVCAHEMSPSSGRAAARYSCGPIARANATLRRRGTGARLRQLAGHAGRCDGNHAHGWRWACTLPTLMPRSSPKRRLRWKSTSSTTPSRVSMIRTRCRRSNASSWPTRPSRTAW